MSVLSRLQDLGGAARAKDIAPTGGRRRQLARLVAEGRVLAHGGGCYALPDADPTIVRARSVRGLITCISAAEIHGLAILDSPTSVHLALPGDRNPARLSRDLRRGLVLHRENSSLLTAGPHPLAPDAGPLVTTPAEALTRTLRCQDPMTAIVAIDSALNRRACGWQDIAVLVVGPGSARVHAVLRECDGRSQSPTESIARVTLRRAGLRVEPNVYVPGVGFVDLLVEGWLVVELDGFAYHAGRRQFREDRRRDRELLAQGFAVLRFTFEDVVGDPAIVVAAVRAVLARGGR